MSAVPIAATPKKRGRPRSPDTVVVKFRMRSDLFDAYCLTALRAGDDVADVMRRVLAVHAPKPSVICCNPK